MKQIFKSFSKVFLSSFLLFINTSCEDCLDLEIINQRTDTFNTWLTDQNLKTKLATSSINISDNVILTHEFQNFGDTIFDDCARVSKSFRSLTHYQFSNFPFQLSTEFYKQGEENGFEYIINYNSERLTYNFIHQTSTKNSIVELDNYNVNNQNYLKLLKIDFESSTTSPNKIQTIYYAKEKGIIQLILNSGIVINLG